MKVIAGMSDRIPLSEIGQYAQLVESLGYDILHVPETIHDSMAVALLALEHTTTLRVQTSLTLAFPRSPMLLALQSWDLSQMSGGRFDLGLATQIKQNIEGRFGIPWTSPIRKMNDYVIAVRTAWNSFATGEPFNVDTENYRMNRLQPFFNPGPLPHAGPQLLLGGVNDNAIRLAGEAADWFVTHPTNSHPRFLRDRALPYLNEGLRTAQRNPQDVQVAIAIPYITGPTESTVDQSRESQRAVLGFLYSTPAYRRTLELFGWDDLGAQLQFMTRSGDWSQLGSLMTDEVLDALIPAGTWDHLPAVINDWFGGLVDAVLIQPSDDYDEEFVQLIQRVKLIESRLNAA
ncbi:MAG: TIGR03617 family F420-dependent LLM class oxidoreductase [Ilumatobacteraceae bacterium]|jgi:probable F420-dependent oxidoreductase|nr:TIGR03617 family F420-dependent LLM class oxidoreductase [Ilumatobacteraceae bacterium]